MSRQAGSLGIIFAFLNKMLNLTSRQLCSPRLHVKVYPKKRSYLQNHYCETAVMNATEYGVKQLYLDRVHGSLVGKTISAHTASLQYGE